MLNTLIFRMNFNKNITLNLFKQKYSLLNLKNVKFFSINLANDKIVSENTTIRDKVIANLDYKKIFKKKIYHRNFKVEDTLSQFSDFETRDNQEMAEVYKKRMYNAEYLKFQDNWQKNLLKNKIRKAITKYKFDNYEFPEVQEEKFVVHNIEKAITLPANDEKLFAVIEFKGLQHKVLKDDRVMLEKIDLNVGETFVFDKILLVASDEFTSIGRPYVLSCKVLAIVEENTKTEKVITFKKNRRKGYQKNMGHRQDVTMIRILKVVHNPKEEILENYHTINTSS